MAFPTEQQVYHRLRWDPRFDVNRCDVVISLRPSGTRRMPLLDLDTNVVPWHRIVEFWVDDELAWSRPRRIDRLAELARSTEEAPPAAFVDDDPGSGRPSVPHRFDAATERWLPAPRARPAAGSGTATALRVVVWNLLFDRYDAERLRSPERWADAFDRLAATTADLIALAEVTPAMWELALAQPWIREHYLASHAPDARSLAPYGQVLLSRHPIVDARVLPLARNGPRGSSAIDRHAVIARIAAGLDLGVAIVHLTSNITDGAHDLRLAQLAAVVERIRAVRRDAWIVAGDFNATPSEHARLVRDAELVDAWETIRPEDPGMTFDIERNPLAAASSITGRSYRYDRILARGLTATAADLLGIEPGPCGLPPSDHFAVCADLARGELGVERAPSSRTTALAILPPAAAWGPIQQIRCTSDRNFERWPPHVTVFFPFVDPTWLERAARVVDEIAAGIEPFELALDRVAPIDRRGKTIVALPAPATEPAVQRLYAALAARFASLVEDRPYKPHLTIARDTDAYPASLPVAWQVDRLAILERRGDRFEVVRESPFAGVRIAPPDPANDRAEAIARRVGELTGARVELFGSSVYAPDHARDVDLIVHGPIDADALGLVPAGAPWRFRGTIDGAAVDLVVAGEDPRWLAGPADAAALVAHLQAHGRHAAFQTAWPGVRAFVDARALAGNGLGWLPMFGWAMLLAVPLCHDPVLCALPGDRVLPAWLAWLGTLAPGAVIGLGARSIAGETEPAALWIAAPAPPSRNIARTLSTGTARHLFGEFGRAARGTAPDPGPTLEVSGTGDPGAYVGRFRSLLDELDVRPWAVEPDPAGGWRHVLGVGDPVTALPVVRGWLARAFPDHPPVARFIRPR